MNTEEPVPPPGEGPGESVPSWRKLLRHDGFRGSAMMVGVAAAVVTVSAGATLAFLGAKGSGEAPAQVDTIAPIGGTTSTGIPATGTPRATAPTGTTTGKSAERTRTVTSTAEPDREQPAGKATTAARTTTTAPKKSSAPTVTNVGLIKNVVTGFCVDLDGSASVPEGSLVRQYDCLPGDEDNQEFETVTQANGAFLIRNTATGWCLDLTGQGNVAARTRVYTGTCQAGPADNQMFRKQAQGDGFYLVHVKSGLCLDVQNSGVGNMAATAELTLYGCTPDDDHVWTFG